MANRGPASVLLLAFSLPGSPLAPLTSPPKRGFYKNYLSLVFLKHAHMRLSTRLGQKIIFDFCRTPA